jgi:hypothetical protein
MIRICDRLWPQEPFEELAMPCPCTTTEEHELPAVEAVLAGTLALMTGYGQALQADLHPEQRLQMGAKIVQNLALLADHPALSETFQRIVLGLRARWRLMSECTAQASPQNSPQAAPEPGLPRWAAPAPRRLQ